MSLLSFFSKPLAQLVTVQTRRWSRKGVATQQRVFKALIRGGRNTAFGNDHDFKNIFCYEDFKQRIPVRDYEGLRTYIERIKA